MKRNTKQFLSLFLSASMALSLTAAPVYADPANAAQPATEETAPLTVENGSDAADRAASRTGGTDAAGVSQQTGSGNGSTQPENSGAQTGTGGQAEVSGQSQTAAPSGTSGQNQPEAQTGTGGQSQPEAPSGTDGQGQTETQTGTGGQDQTASGTNGQSAAPAALSAAENSRMRIRDSISMFSVDASQIEAPEVNVNEDPGAEEVTVDENDPEIAVVKEELENITVLNEEGASVALTEEQIQTVLGMFQMYTDQWKANADILGVQSPFYLSFNDNGEDGLGVLGEMLTLAGVSVDDVRTGNYSYDDLCGMIMNFQYGDQYGIQFYGDTIRTKRDAALAAVESSGAVTDVQKLLVLNDWVAQNCTFDMAYIMNQMGDEPVMSASEPVEHPHYQEVYNGMAEVYRPQIEAQFHDQFYAVVEEQARQSAYQDAIKGIAGQMYQAEHPDAAQEEVDAYAEQYLADNQEAITADAYGFMVTNFGEETAAAVKGQVDEALASEETKAQLEAATAQIMDMPMDELGGSSPNQMIPVYVDQAAAGLTQGIIGYWGGNQFGALAEGKAVCMGYAKAYAYLVQCMYPEYYGVNGAGTDLTVAENWKQPKDLYYDENGNLDINQAYNVDLVRITFQAEVSMYGEVQPDFNSDHFWNAVKIDGEWYYVDPCYTDVWTEVMSRDRVETDGYLNHLYFMLSHASAATMFDGNYKVIRGLYNDVSNNKQYEDSWVSRIASNVYSDGEYFYYLYDSTDMISMLEDFNNSNGNYQDLEFEDSVYKLVRHKITSNDVGDGDTDYETLIEFNYKESEDADTTVSRVLDPSTGKLQENELVTKLYEQFTVDQSGYPSLHITPVLYGGKVYFNMSNCILSYDIASGAVTEIKEYNTVYGVRDDSVVFGGMAFSSTSADNADFAFENHPLAGMALKDDGKLYVSVATNLAYISGKDPHNYEDNSSFGWEYEESNYNQNYQSYAQQHMEDSGVSEDMIEQMGYKLETNDNDEFMWVANIVDTVDMAHLAGGSHTYGEVTVEPYCGRDGYTENRCSTCGAIEDGSRTVAEGTALEHHHYLRFDEEYYTKDDDENWNTGTSYVCAMCGYAVSEPAEPSKNYQESDEEYAQRVENYEKLKAAYDEAVATAGHTYAPTDAQWSGDYRTVTFSNLTCTSVCPERKNALDLLLDDSTVSAALSAQVTAAAALTNAEGTCAEGVVSTYTAAGEADGFGYTAETTVTWPAGEHSYADGACTKCGEPDPTALAAPVIESVYSRLQTTVKVTWNKEENAAGYQLWRAERPDAADGEWVLAKTITGANMDQYTREDTIQYTNVELEVGTTYYYKVRSFIMKSGVTDESDEASRIYSPYSEVKYMPAAVVLGNIYSAAPNKVRLNWTEVNGAHGYQIWRMGEDGTYTIVKTLGDKGNELTDNQGGTTAYSNVNLEAGETYTYKIRAFMIPGDGTKVFGAYSDEFKVATMPESTTLTGTSKKAGRADLSWSKVNGAAGYQIWMAESSGEYKIVKSIEDGSTVSYTKYDLKSGETYKFKVRAYTEVDGKKTFGADSEQISVVIK